MSGFDYQPHPRIEGRKQAGPPKVRDSASKVHGGSWIGRFNAKVGLRITLVVGTMWAAYLFAALAFISLPSALESANALVIVAWIAQTFLQLVLLPIIIVGQNIQAQAADARAESTYKDAEAVLEEAKQIQAHLAAQDAQITQILAQLQAAERNR